MSFTPLILNFTTNSRSRSTEPIIPHPRITLRPDARRLKLARIIHDGSLQNRAAGMQDRREIKWRSPPNAGDGRRCLVCLCREPYRGAGQARKARLDVRSSEFEVLTPNCCPSHPSRFSRPSRLSAVTRRNTGHTRTDAAATAWDRLPYGVCSRSRPRSGPC